MRLFWSRSLSKVALALYLVSLVSPCALHDDYPEDAYQFGLEILFEGWFGIVALEFHWYANPLFFYVIYRAWNGRHVPAKALFAVALFLAAITVVFPVVDTDYGITTFSPYLAHVKEVLFGTYIWAACMALGAVICFAAPRIHAPESVRAGAAAVK